MLTDVTDCAGQGNENIIGVIVHNSTGGFHSSDTSQIVVLQGGENATVKDPLCHLFQTPPPFSLRARLEIPG
jgi:hypothetical protein